MSLKDFEILAPLGEGSYSSVWKVKRLVDGKEYAMKRVKMANLSEKDKLNALNEVRILASINSSFIIGYKEAFFDDESMSLCIIMELAAGGDIGRKIHQHQKKRTFFDESEIWSVFVHILKGLKMLHSNKILHRDIKSANIFLTADNKAKLGDLNVSKVAKNNLAYTQTGTPYYASPEVWKDMPYDKKCDIWSLGCVIYEMAALKPPFRADDLSELKRRVMRGVFERIPAYYSSELNEVISICLKTSPIVRPSCEQLLSHPIVLKHIKSVESSAGEDPQHLPLLSTIRVPKNLKVLSSQLPKPNYEGRFAEIAKISCNENENPHANDNVIKENFPLAEQTPNMKTSVKKRQEDYFGKETANPGAFLPKVLDSYKRAAPPQPTTNNIRTISAPRKASNNAINRNNMLPFPREVNRPSPTSCESNINLSRQDEIIRKYQQIDAKIQKNTQNDKIVSEQKKLEENYVNRKTGNLLTKQANLEYKPVETSIMGNQICLKLNYKYHPNNNNTIRYGNQLAPRKLDSNTALARFESYTKNPSKQEAAIA